MALRKGIIMNTEPDTTAATPEDHRLAVKAANLRRRANEAMCMADARVRTALAQPEQGAATAEYAVVLVAATGFAALLTAILKSGTVKTMLLNIIKQALQLG